MGTRALACPTTFRLGDLVHFELSLPACEPAAHSLDGTTVTNKAITYIHVHDRHGQSWAVEDECHDGDDARFGSHSHAKGFEIREYDMAGDHSILRGTFSVDKMGPGEYYLSAYRYVQHGDSSERYHTDMFMLE